MSDYIGLITLESPIYCTKEVSGKQFRCNIAGIDFLVIFPAIPNDFDITKLDWESNKLIGPGDLFKGKIDWGKVMHFPQCTFSVNALLCYLSINESEAHKIYDEFPRWKDKFIKLHIINKGDYLQPEQKLPGIVRGGGFYDGLQLFQVDGKNKLKHVINSRTTEAIKLHFIESNEAYTPDEISLLLANTGNNNEIALTYELLITAYYSMQRNDFRSAVILAGTAVEKAILKRMRSEYPTLIQFQQESSKHRMLGGKFRWLAEKGIFIPVADYQTVIVDVRNNAAHDGIRPSYSETKQCLEKCKILIETYHPQVLE